MSAPGVSPFEQLKARAKVVREQFTASGTSISEWARERGFQVSLVIDVLAGNRPCVRGSSYKIAVALGLKEAAPPPGGAPAGSLPVMDGHPEGFRP